MKYGMRKQNKKLNSFVTNYTTWGEAVILLVRTLMAKCHNFPLRAVIMFNKMLLTSSVSVDGSSISFFTYKNMPDILREVYAIQGTAGFMQIKQFSKGLFVIFFTSPRTFSLSVPVWPSVDLLGRWSLWLSHSGQHGVTCRWPLSWSTSTPAL